MAILAHTLLDEMEDRERNMAFILHKSILRDKCNPFDVSDFNFKNLYRLTKNGISMIIKGLRPFLTKNRKNVKALKFKYLSRFNFWQRVLTKEEFVMILCTRLVSRVGAICLTYCNYLIVQEVAKELGMKTVQYTENWDLCWCDLTLDIKKAKELKKYQKMNHFLGVSEISRKDSLARNLNAMAKHFQEDYNFFPKTWYLPHDYTKLKSYMSQHRSSTFIFKPSAGSRGIGIYLSKSIKSINQSESMICQLYVSNPLLIDGFKFDMRVYILLASCDPLKIYVYNDGIVRLATEPYKKPTIENLKNVFMHLTNYAVNKSSLNYVDHEISGSKRRITTLNKRLADQGYDVGKMWNEIDDVIIKTVILAYPLVNRTYKTCFSSHKYMPACFDILGFDILLDDKCKPHLLEVNHSPDLNTNTKIDKIVKRELLMDTFKLLQLDKNFQKIVSMEQKWKIEHAMNVDQAVYKQKILECQKKFEQHNNVWESKNMGNYRLVYSEENESLYERFFYWNESSLYRNPRLLITQESVIKVDKMWRNCRPPKSIKGQKSIVVSTPPLIMMPLRKHSYLKRNIKDHIKIKTEVVTPNVTNASSKSTYGKNKRNIIKSISQQLETNKLVVNSIHKTSLNTKLFGSTIKILKRQQIIIADTSTSRYLASCSEDTDDIDSNGRREIALIKKMNQKKFPNAQSCLFSKFTKKKGCFMDGWNDAFIDQIEENTRLAYMSQRSDMIIKLGIKDYIYNEFKLKNHLSQFDHSDYAAYQKRKEHLRIKPLVHHNVLHVTLIE